MTRDIPEIFPGYTLNKYLLVAGGKGMQAPVVPASQTLRKHSEMAQLLIESNSFIFANPIFRAYTISKTLI